MRVHGSRKTPMPIKLPATTQNDGKFGTPSFVNYLLD